jgi:hypothetical protein
MASICSAKLNQPLITVVAAPPPPIGTTPPMFARTTSTQLTVADFRSSRSE